MNSHGLVEARPTYGGSCVRSLHWLLRQCAVGEIGCSQQAMMQVRRTIPGCHLSDLITVDEVDAATSAAVDRVMWRPQVTAQVRRDSIHRRAERSASERPVQQPAGVGSTLLLYEKQVAHLFYEELFRILPTKNRSDLLQLVLRRLEIPSHKHPRHRLSGGRCNLAKDVGVMVDGLFKQVGPMSSIPVAQQSLTQTATQHLANQDGEVCAFELSVSSTGSKGDATTPAARSPLVPPAH